MAYRGLTANTVRGVAHRPLDDQGVISPSGCKEQKVIQFSPLFEIAAANVFEGGLIQDFDQ